MAMSDPYTAVSHHLQEGAASRAELAVLTDLGPELIDAALHRFETMDSVVKFKKGGEDYYRWKQGVEPPEPQPAPCSSAFYKDGVADESELNPNTKGRPTGWSLAGKIREMLDTLQDGDEFTIPIVYNSLLAKYPNACETYEAGSLRTQISATLNSFIGKAITIAKRGDGRSPNVYRKGLGVKLSAQRNGQKLLSQLGQDAARIVTTKEPDSVRPTRLQSIAPDNSQDKNKPTIHVQSQPTNPYTVVLNQLRSERDELNVLIELLERRLVRGGGGLGG